jgi:hypothetical protein
MQTSDVRRYRRHPLVLKVELEGADGHLHYLTDLSPGGLRLHSTGPLTIGLPVRARFCFPGFMEPIGAEGQVRWGRSGNDHSWPYAGIAFRNNQPETVQRILTLLERFEGQEDAVGSRGPLRILLAEGNPMLADIFRYEAQKYPHSIQLESTSHEERVLAAIDERACSLVIFDLDGLPFAALDTVERLRRIPRFQWVPFVVMSTVSPQTLSFRSCARSMFLRKPVPLGHLLHTFRAFQAA